MTTRPTVVARTGPAPGLALALACALAACGPPPAPSGTPAGAVGSTPSPTAAATLSPPPTVATRVPTATAAVRPPLPDGFPIAPDTVPASSGDDPDVIAAWSSRGAAGASYRFYREALPAAGYTIDLDAPGGAAAVLRFRAGDGERLQLSFFVVEGEERIELRLPGP